jgi:hypothetical protein
VYRWVIWVTESWIWLLENWNAPLENQKLRVVS